MEWAERTFSASERGRTTREESQPLPRHPALSPACLSREHWVMIKGPAVRAGGLSALPRAPGVLGHPAQGDGLHMDAEWLMGQLDPAGSGAGEEDGTERCFNHHQHAEKRNLVVVTEVCWLPARPSKTCVWTPFPALWWLRGSGEVSPRQGKFCCFSSLFQGEASLDAKEKKKKIQT